MTHSTGHTAEHTAAEQEGRGHTERLSKYEHIISASHGYFLLQRNDAESMNRLDRHKEKRKWL